MSKALTCLLLISCLAAVPQAPIGEAAVDEAECTKVGTCSCKLKNVNNTGLINLQTLVDGSPSPRFIVGSDYTYYYNPCTNFVVNSSNRGCEEGVALCQKSKDSKYAYSLGKAEDVEFKYTTGSVFAVYHDATTPNDGYTRSSEIELVCDETTYGKLEFIAEPVTAFYKFRLYSVCACPGRCRSNHTMDCINIDSCTCETTNGLTPINLHALDKPAEPLEDEISSSTQLYYNPCSPVMSPHCGDQSVCMKDGDAIVGFGSANSGKFETSKDEELSLQYTNGGRTSTVHLKCDESIQDKPFFRVEEVSANHSTMIMYSVCACRDGCKTPPLVECSITDYCSCEVKGDGRKFSLHKLDNRYAPLTVTDRNGYTYYYNPCSGVEYVTESFSCRGVTGCQTDSLALRSYSLGTIPPTNATIGSDGNLVFHYAGGDDGRSFDVKVVCNPSTGTDPIFSIDGFIPQGTLHYKFLLSTNEGCPQ